MQPDVALLKPRADFFASALPGSTDVVLIVEVADTTVRYDREVKVPLYARAAVLEVWLVDLLSDRIEISTQPSPEGYRGQRLARRGDRVRSAAWPELDLRAADILGPRP